jgi:hypothetical protein
MVFEKSVSSPFNHLTRLKSRDNFIIQCVQLCNSGFLRAIIDLYLQHMTDLTKANEWCK